MTYRIYRTARYGDDTGAARDFPSSFTADGTQKQAEYLAAALSTYSDAGCDDQFLVECPECGHADVMECRPHVLAVRPVSPVAKALDFAIRYGGIGGDHHKAWVIDQMVRALAGDDYSGIVAGACAGGWDWDVGVTP